MTARIRRGRPRALALTLGLASVKGTAQRLGQVEETVRADGKDGRVPRRRGAGVDGESLAQFVENGGGRLRVGWAQAIDF